MDKGVILLHGIFRTAKSMGRLEKYLSARGYHVLNVDYPSTKMSLEQIVDYIHPQIAEFASGLDGSVSFVGYSMGGLVTRAYLAKYRPQNLFRVVMLGTPNKGSEIADFVRNWRLYKRLYGPAGQQLVTLQDEFAHLFGVTDYELGIVAGNWSIDPISSLIIGSRNDGKVSVASTKLDGMKDHVIVPVPHTLFPAMRIVHKKVLLFLNNGSFSL